MAQRRTDKIMKLTTITLGLLSESPRNWTATRCSISRFWLLNRNITDLFRFLSSFSDHTVITHQNYTYLALTKRYEEGHLTLMQPTQRPNVERATVLIK